MTAPAAVVLAAGEGRRLRPLTRLRPKALCPLGGSTLLDLALADVAATAVDLAVNAHHLAGQVVDHLAGRVQVSVEGPVALGTAGALGALRGWVDGRDVLVRNADAYLPGGCAGLTDGWDGVRPRLLVGHAPGRGDFGDDRYLGACLLPWSTVRDLRPVPGGLYEVCWAAAWARGGLDLVRTHGFALDAGTPADYLAANLHAAGGDSVVGAGARVAGELVRSVVWPGAVVAAGERLVDAIRADDGTTVRAGGRRGDR